MQFNIIILSILSILMSSLAIADDSACTELPNRIYHDIKKYSASIEQQHLSWMNIKWLENKLGEAQIEKLENNETRYYWACENGAGAALSVDVDQHGKMVHISGQYHLSHGSGMFSSAFKNTTQPGEAVEQQKVSALTQLTPPLPETNSY